MHVRLAEDPVYINKNTFQKRFFVVSMFVFAFSIYFVITRYMTHGSPFASGKKEQHFGRILLLEKYDKS